MMPTEGRFTTNDALVWLESADSIKSLQRLGLTILSKFNYTAEEKEDIISQATLKLIKQLRKIKDGNRLSYDMPSIDSLFMIYATGINRLAIDLLRQKQTQFPNILPLEDFAPDPSFKDGFDLQFDSSLLQEFLASDPTNPSKVRYHWLLTQLVSGYSYEEIVERHQRRFPGKAVKLGTIKSAMMRAKDAFALFVQSCHPEIASEYLGAKGRANTQSRLEMKETRNTAYHRRKKKKT